MTETAAPRIDHTRREAFVRGAGNAITRPVPRIPLDILSMPGFGTSLGLDLLNNLCRVPFYCRYLEFGSWCGRSLAAAAYQNAGLFIGVDNRSQFQHVDVQGWLENMIGPARNALFLELEHEHFVTLPRTVDVFFYDSDHSRAATHKAVLQVAPMLADPAIIVFDDLELGDVAIGLEQGLDEAKATRGLEIVQEWTLSRAKGFHEGMYVAVVSKAPTP